MSARAALKRATADAHERVDLLFSGLKLEDPRDYRRFLVAQAAAHLPVEQALDDAGALCHSFLKAKVGGSKAAGRP